MDLIFNKIKSTFPNPINQRTQVTQSKSNEKTVNTANMYQSNIPFLRANSKIRYNQVVTIDLENNSVSYDIQ